MKIDQQELTERLAKADRAIVTLRKATLELVAAGRSLLDDRKKDEPDDADRSDRQMAPVLEQPHSSDDKKQD